MDQPMQSRETAARLDEATANECAALLQAARLIVLSPSSDTEEPVDVVLYFQPNHPHFPLPGSTLWRTALQHWLTQPSDSTPEDAIIRSQVERSLQRFPSIETWWTALRSGWTRPAWLPRARPGRATGA